MGLEPEKKFHDIEITGITGTPNGALWTLGTVPQGASQSARVGRKIIVTDILFDGYVFVPSQATNGPETVFRLEIVLDTQTNGAEFTVSDYRAIHGVSVIHGFRNLNSVERFQTLYRGPLVGANASASVGIAYNAADELTERVIQPGLIIPTAFNIKTCVEIEYDDSDTDGSISTQTTNSIHILFWDIFGGPTSRLHGTTRVRYVDS